MKKFIFESAYFRLTAFYVLIVMIISLSFSAIIFAISSNELERGLGRQTGFFRGLPPNNILNISMDEIEKIRLEELATSNNHLKMNLIYFNLLILFLSSVLSYFLAKRTLRPIEEMVDAQNRFIADASHELKTPLTAMRAEIEVNLRDQKLSLPASKKLLSSNLDEIQKLEALSNALLNLAKYQEDPQLEFEQLSLTEIMAEAYEKVEKLARQKSIEFKNNFEPIEIKGDKQGLLQLLTTLLDNAIKYSPKDSTIAINIKKHDKLAEITIADHGIGIKASELPYIFNRFYRADTSRNKEKVDGYGLGLAIAKRVVELHHGSITASSKPDKGTKFIIKLPI